MKNLLFQVSLFTCSVSLAHAATTGGFNSAVGGRYATRTAGTLGDWYRMTITPDFANLDVTLAVFNLTTNTAVTLGTSTFDRTADHFGVTPTAYEGITARSSNNPGGYGIDNIQIIPEPSAALLGGLGMLFLLRRRR